jgi:hypothetical protein
VTATLVPLSGFAEVHASLAAFYAADPRRWPSREIDVGLRWRGPGQSTYRAAYIEETTELYLFEHLRSDGGGGMVFVHERACAHWGRAEIFRGWKPICGNEGSLAWFLSRANRRCKASPRPGRGSR